jgi:polyphenol oxidase
MQAGSPAPLVWTMGADVRVAFSHIGDGDQREATARARFLARVGCRRACAYGLQIHGAQVAIADPLRPPPPADALITDDRDIALMAFGADCPGVCLVTPDAIAIAHCGWRGTAAGIVASVVGALDAITREPRPTWRALIGPGIAGADYEVDAPVLAARTWPPSAVTPARPGRCLLDLRCAIAADLERAAIDQVEVVDVATSQDPRLWSYRKRGAGMVQGLVVWRT